jgi:hypothetical protein
LRASDYAAVVSYGTKIHRLKSVLLQNMTNQLNNLNDLAILNGESEGPNDGFVAPLDGAQSAQGATASLGAHAARAPLGIDGKQSAANAQEALAKLALGPNFVGRGFSRDLQSSRKPGL